MIKMNQKKIFTLKKVNDYVYKKQHVLPNYQLNSIKDVSKNLVGLHSARLTTPYITLYSRVTNFQTKDLHAELYKKKNLIKLRCMRKTLHTVPIEIASIFHQSTIKIRLSDCFSVYKKMKIQDETIIKFKKYISDIVKDKPLSSNEILDRIINNRTLSDESLKINHLSEKERITFYRTIIKHLWEEGTFCYINANKHWGSENRLYGFTKTFYPNLDLFSFSIEESQKRLIYHHIECYGPVTEKDIIWWSGLSQKVIRESMESFSDELISIKIYELDYIFYMTKKDYKKFINFPEVDSNWFSLLAHEDPSLKAYYESRYRYVNSKNYEKLFNSIGEARASIMLNGEVIGLWEWDKKKMKIQYSLFNEIEKDTIELIKKEMFNLERSFNPNKVTLLDF